MKTTAFAWDQVLRALRAALEPDYTIEELIGVGAMASVYRARRNGDSTVVALKALHAGLIRNDHDRARFLREAGTLARLRHPHVVTLTGVIERAGVLCLDLAYLPGGSLARLLADRPAGLPLTVALHWLAQVGSAISYAHDAGVLHRDLNPSNVLLDATGHAAVADFGIASVAGDAKLTLLGQRIGTPAYMSPEQLEDRALTRATDQYSLGIIAYEMLTGRRPFYGPERHVVEAQLSTVPLPPARLRRDCPAHINAAIQRMLEKHPDHRFPSITLALNALGARELTRHHPALAPFRVTCAHDTPPQ